MPVMHMGALGAMAVGKMKLAPRPKSITAARPVSAIARSTAVVVQRAVATPAPPPTHAVGRTSTSSTPALPAPQAAPPPASGGGVAYDGGYGDGADYERSGRGDAPPPPSPVPQYRTAADFSPPTAGPKDGIPVWVAVAGIALVAVVGGVLAHRAGAFA